MFSGAVGAGWARNPDLQTHCSDGSGCKVCNGMPPAAQAAIINYYNFVRQLPQNERSSQLNSCLVPLVPLDAMALPRERSTGSKRAKGSPHAKYQLFGTPVCLSMLASAHGLSLHAVQNKTKTLRQGIMPPLLHVPTPPSSHSSQIKFWLDHFASVNGFPSPSSRECNTEHNIIYLPFGLTKAAVYDTFQAEYVEAFQEEAPSPSTFEYVWATEMPHLRTANKYTGFCDMCTALMGEPDRTMIKGHLQRVKAVREYIHGRQAAALKSLQLPYKDRKHLALFDFAQVALLPHLGLEPSLEFFMSGFKVDIFGIFDFAAGQQWTYLLTEGHWPGSKDANSVCSMLYHYIRNNSAASASDVLYFSSDNCGGQVGKKKKRGGGERKKKKKK
mgnify:CR=1 FL=1